MVRKKSLLALDFIYLDVSKHDIIIPLLSLCLSHTSICYFIDKSPINFVIFYDILCINFIYAAAAVALHK